MINKQDDILTTGTLYWYKAGRRGIVPVPLELLSEDQKQTLRSGLGSKRYQLDVNIYTLSPRYVWAEECGLEVQVTDIDLSPEIKRKLRPPKKIAEKTPYQFTLKDMTRLQTEFVAGVVDEAFVQNILSRRPWRPWQYAEWKSMRDLKIQDVCENCGKTTDLILQHTVQLRNIKSIIFEIVKEQYEEFLLYILQNIHKIDLPLPENIKKVPVCPKCGSSRVRHRIRKDNYICEKTRNHVICKHEFITPDFGYDERDIQTAEKKRRSMLRDRFCLERGIYHEATAIALEELISYLKMNHVKTLCNKCAFNEDRPYGKF